MSYYRRAKTADATYFFTVVSYRRQAILCDAPVRKAIRQTIVEVRNKSPFAIEAWVLLPENLHLDDAVKKETPGIDDVATPFLGTSNS